MSERPDPPQAASPRRVGMISLGCPKNLVDSEVMLGELRARGHQIVTDAADADTVIVNTCGFIDEAKQESIDTILEIAGNKAPGKKLLVAGCMVNRYGKELAAEIPEIDGFIGLDDLRTVADHLGPARTPKLTQLGAQLGEGTAPAPSHAVFDHTAPRTLTTHGYAYLKVAEGCDNPCTFCAIPQWRGKFRSRTVDSLVEEAKNLEQTGIQELCLIAQDTTRYGGDLLDPKERKTGLTRLVEALLAGTSIPWLRFLYAYPTTLDESLLRLMAAEERFCSYLDMPLQHSHPDILTAMRRGGKRERYLRLLARARELAPDVALRSTFIVGFPGETEEHFEDLLDFVREARLDHLGGFVYSPEEGTPAAELPNRVPRGVARRRHERLLEVQKPISLARRKRLEGRVLDVLVEGTHPETDHLLRGRHAGQAPDIDGYVLINDGLAPAGTIARVEITEGFADDLVGRVVGPAGAPGVVVSPDAMAAEPAALAVSSH